jgi:PHD/YefM family antitoxin component YafN of YafNO toxin-antitoxin module
MDNLHWRKYNIDGCEYDIGETNMKAGSIVANKDSLLELIGHLVPISDFSKGKTAKIFEDIKKNRSKYIVLKNNQPSAVLMSIEHYSEIMQKAGKMEALLERIEDTRLLTQANAVAAKYKKKTAYSQESILSELGIAEQDVDTLADSVEIE